LLPDSRFRKASNYYGVLQSSHAAAFVAADDVYMGAAVGALKYTGYQYIAHAERDAADRTPSF
jgi:hypothetical protein